jgi:hypothetical protein
LLTVGCGVNPWVVGATEGTPKVGYGVGICEGAERDDWLLTTEQVTILSTLWFVAGA